MALHLHCLPSVGADCLRHVSLMLNAGWKVFAYPHRLVVRDSLQKVMHVLHCGRVRDLETMPADSPTVRAPQRITLQRAYSHSPRLQSSAAPPQSHGMPHLPPHSTTDVADSLLLCISSGSGIHQRQQQLNAW